MFLTQFNEPEKLWYGPDIPPLFNPNINLAQALLNSMSIFGSKVAQVNKKNQKVINLGMKEGSSQFSR